MTARNKRHKRVGRHRPDEQGLTLIELLLSLAILAVLTGFLAGGLSMSRRAFDADRISSIGVETDAEIQTIATVIGSALPVRSGTGDQQAPVAFDGREDSMLFIGLSEGRSLRGGPHRIGLRQIGSDVVIDVAESKKKAVPEPPIPAVVALRGIRRIHFGYFGRINPSAAAGWRTDWAGLERLPDLVSVRVEFDDERRNEPAIIVALRQG